MIRSLLMLLFATNLKGQFAELAPAPKLFYLGLESRNIA
jgi:hypothetical protein